MDVAIACNVSVALGISLYAEISKAVDAYKHYSLPETLFPPIPPTQKRWENLSDKALLRVIHAVFYSSQTAASFNQIIGGISNSREAKDPTRWIGKGACGTMSILTYIVLKHMGFTPKIVGILEDMQDIDSARYSGWHGMKAPLHVWVEIDSLENTRTQNPLWIDLTCRQFTGISDKPADIENPHGAIGFKDQFLEFTGPQKSHWEGAVDVTDFFERYTAALEKELYSPISSHQISFLELDFRNTYQIQTGLRDLLTATNTMSESDFINGHDDKIQ